MRRVYRLVCVCVCVCLVLVYIAALYNSWRRWIARNKTCISCEWSHLIQQQHLLTGHSACLSISISLSLSLYLSLSSPLSALLYTASLWLKHSTAKQEFLKTVLSSIVAAWAPKRNIRASTCQWLNQRDKVNFDFHISELLPTRPWWHLKLRTNSRRLPTPCKADGASGLSEFSVCYHNISFFVFLLWSLRHPHRSNWWTDGGWLTSYNVFPCKSVLFGASLNCLLI